MSNSKDVLSQPCVPVSQGDREKSMLLIDPLASGKFTFDQSLELVGYGRFHWMLLIGTGIGCVSIMVEDNCMSFVLPAAKCDLHLTPTEQGFMYVASTMGFVCSSHLWGFVADTWGRRKVLRTALLLCSFTSAASSLSTTSGMLMASRFVVGLCLSGVKGTSMSYLGEFHSARMRPVHLSLLSSCIMSSLILQPLMAMAVLQHSDDAFPIKPWRLFILIGCLVSALGALLMHWLPESPKFLLAMGKPKEALDVLRCMHAVNSGDPLEPFAVSNILPLESAGTALSSIKSFGSAMSLIWAQTKPLLMSPNRTNFLLCCTFTMSTFFVTHGILLWFPQILTIYSSVPERAITTCSALAVGFEMSTLENAHQTNTTTFPGGETCKTTTLNITTLTITLMLGFFMVTLNTLIGLGMQRIGPKVLQSTWFVCATVATFALIFGRIFELNAFLMIVIISCSGSVASMCGVFGDLFPTHLRSMAMNLIMMCGRLGGVAGSNVLAATIYWHCSKMLGVYVAMLTLSAAIVWKVSARCERVRNI